MGTKAIARNVGVRKGAGHAKNVALFLAAPFIGLAYIVVMPVVGLGALAWMGIKELARKRTGKTGESKAGLEQR